jgi:drug/metabolite transporter (DMT)-like permease
MINFTQSVMVAGEKASTDITVKRSYLVELLALGSVALGALGQLLLKASLLLVSNHRDVSMTIGYARTVCAVGIVLGLGIYAVGTLFWVRAVSRASISYLYPLSAASYAVVALFGHLLFGEIMPPWRWIGIAVMSTGVALLAADGEQGAA